MKWTFSLSHSNYIGFFKAAYFEKRITFFWKKIIELWKKILKARKKTVSKSSIYRQCDEFLAGDRP